MAKLNKEQVEARLLKSFKLKLYEMSDKLLGDFVDAIANEQDIRKDATINEQLTNKTKEA